MPTHMSNVDEKLNGVNASPVAEDVTPIVEEVKADAPKSEEVKVEDEVAYEEPREGVDAKATESKDQDEFGNEVTPPKTYTEEEVNRMMRERFKRTQEGKREEQRQEAPREEEGENWEAQLEGFVEKTVQKLSQKQINQQRESREREIQAEFEDRFQRGIGKYKDFKEVVQKAPISDEMLLATRSMKDPAAFIYAASKTQGKELERISKIQDPYTQVAEMGRLEERMRKLRGATSSPKPLSEVKGDIANRENIRQNVDELIRKDQLKKFQRRY